LIRPKQRIGATWIVPTRPPKHTNVEVMLRYLTIVEENTFITQSTDYISEKYDVFKPFPDRTVVELTSGEL